MKNIRILALVMALVLCFGMMTGCAKPAAETEKAPESSTEKEPAGSTEEETPAEGGSIKIALIANTTGDYAMYGIPVRNGAMQYIDEINEAGGINGKQIEVLEYDDEGDGIEAVSSFKLAMDNGITAVLGSVLTGPTITLADETNLENMPQVTASATAAGVTLFDPEDPEAGIRENVFRSCFIDPFQGEKMADYAVNKLGATTAAILYEAGGDYSEGLKAAFEAKAAELGLEIVATEAFATGDKDFNAQMAKIAQTTPDVVFAPFYYAEAGLAITQARAAGLEATFLGGDGFGGIKDYASAEDLEGTVYCSGYAPGTDSVKDFETNYETIYGEAVPNMFAPLAYDAAMLLCTGLTAAEEAGLEAGSEEYKQAVIDAIAGCDAVEGITGSYTFNEFNDPIKSAAMMVVAEGAETFTELY